MMGTTRTLAVAGLVLAGFAGQASAQHRFTSDVPHPPMRAGVAAPQFWDPDLGKWWSCTAGSPTTQRGHIVEPLKWNIVQNGNECFPGTNIIVPFRVVTEAWFELDADGNALDPDYIPPNPDIDGMGTEEDVCERMDANEILVEDMAVDLDENFPIIVEAMDVIERLCGVTFVQRDPNNDDCFPGASMMPGGPPAQPWIRIQQSTDECPPREDFDFTGNHSALGMVGMPVQVIVMEDWSVAVMVHELMHALGFWHEHQRFDRDDYVTIRQEHVLPNDISQFFKIEEPSFAFGEYDFESIMHYGRFAFSFNGQPTIEVLPQFANLGDEPGYAQTIGTFPRPSSGDRAALEFLYGATALNACDLADFNDDDDVDATDLLAFITAWVNELPSADFNMDGEITDLDLLQYLGAFGNANNCDPTIPPLYDIRNNTVGRPI